MFGKKLVTDMVTRSAENEHDRRSFMRAAGLAGLGTVGAVALSGTSLESASAAPVINDGTILNFALNLEYLEAEFYLRAVTGEGLSSGDTSGTVGTFGKVSGGHKVPFKSRTVAKYAREIAQDERQHVRFLRGALGGAKVARPARDRTVEPGQVAGCNHTAVGRRAGEEVIRLIHPQQVAPEAEGQETGDFITITGVPDISMSTGPEIAGGKATAGICVNTIPRIVAATPGLKRIIDLPSPCALMGPSAYERR